MINWFDMPAEGLSNGGQFEVKELEVTENGTYEEKGEMYNKVTVNVEGGGESDFSTAQVTVVNNYRQNADIRVAIAPSEYSTSDAIANVDTNTTAILNVILFKGSATGNIDAGTALDYNIEAEGNAEVDASDFFITGDCTITIS